MSPPEGNSSFLDSDRVSSLVFFIEAKVREYEGEKKGGRFELRKDLEYRLGREAREEGKTKRGEARRGETGRDEARRGSEKIGGREVAGSSGGKRNETKEGRSGVKGWWGISS